MLRPVPLQVVDPAHAAEVISPPYDALDQLDRLAWAAERPLSFLHVTASPLEPSSGAADAAARANAAALRRLLDAGAFGPPLPPAFGVLELSVAGHRQRHVLGEVVVDDLGRHHLRYHERTRPERVDVLVRSLRAVRAWSSPISVTFPDTSEDRDRLDEVCAGEPLLDHEGPTLRIRLWSSDRDDLSPAGPLYVVDGHHRAEAGRRWAEQGGPRGLLVAAAPATELRVLPFHRIVVGGAARARAGLDLTPVAGPGEAAPPGFGTFGVHLDGRWWRLDTGAAPTGDLLTDLDPVVLEREVLGPVFGIDGRSRRIQEVPGVVGADELARRCHADDGVGLLIGAVPLDVVMAVADRGEVLPPKSTWFDPKPRSGVVLRRV